MVERITAQSFAEEYRAVVNDIAPDLLVDYGDFDSAYVVPTSILLEKQNEALRRVSDRLSRQNPSLHSEEEADALASNEGVFRSTGERALVTLRFVRAAEPLGDLAIERGEAFTIQNEAAETTTFTIVERTVLPFATRASYRDATTGLYTLDVVARAVAEGTAGNVGPQQIKRPLRTLSGFDSVTNPKKSQGGANREDNASLFQRLELGVAGRQPLTLLGIERRTRDGYAAVLDALAVASSDPLVTRAGAESGAVDVFIQGETPLSVTESLEPYLGIGQLVPVHAAPIIDVTSVQVGATIYTEGTHYEIVFDETGLSGSSRAVEGIRFLPAVTPVPALGALVQITYTNDALIRTLQADFSSAKLTVAGQSLLFRRATPVRFFLAADVTPIAGITEAAAIAQAETLIDAFFTAKRLGGRIEQSDLNAEARKSTAIDNFQITRLSRDGTDTTVADRDVAANEYATLAAIDRIVV